MSELGSERAMEVTPHERREHGFDSDAEVRVTAIWRGQEYEFTTRVLAQRATHYAVDRELYKAHIEVRRKLAEVEYPGRILPHKNGPVRDESALWNGIAAYLYQNPEKRFEFVPPNRGFNQWRAYFKTKQDELFAIEMNPPVGVGTSYAVALENLLRYVEGKEPTDG